MPRGSLALIGLGPWGRRHQRVLNELEELRWVWDSDPAVLSEHADAAQAADGLDAILDDRQVRGVVLATPARTHYELAKRVLEAKKDVFVEKPLTLDEKEGEELVRLSDVQGAVLMVGHITLYHPAVLVLKDLVDRGVLGDLRYLYANRLNLGTVREEEDILWSFAPHDIACFLHLLGRWPERVAASGGSYLRPGRADVTVTHLDFPENVHAHIFVSWLHPMKEHRLVVIGERRMAVFTDGADGGRLLLFDPGTFRDGRPVGAAAEGEPVAFPRVEPLRMQMVHFLECLDHRDEPLSGGRHGLEVLRVLETARRSLGEHGAPLPCNPVEFAT